MNKINEQTNFLEYFFYGLIIICFLSAFLFDNSFNILNGFIKIIRTQEVLLTDYFKIGGFGATLINVSLVMVLTMLIIKYNKITVNGFVFAAVLTLAGFSLFGKNIYNITPIFLGVYLYSIYSKEQYKSYFPIAIFATCLSPLIGVNFFDNAFGVVLNILIGTIYGFVIVPLSSHVMKFHNGYTLYNVGFAGGLFAIVLVALLRTLGIKLDVVNYITYEYHTILLYFVLSISLFFIILAFINKDFSLQDYRNLTKKSGRIVTDYFALFNKSSVFFNIGIMGLISLIISLISNIPLNGPIVGVILTVMGFSVFGVSPINSLIVMVGCFIMHLLSYESQFTTIELIAILLVVGIAPIAGKYGLIWGIVAGMLHYSVVKFSGEWQGGLNLYNNGFASGLVAGVVVSIIEHLKKEKQG